MHQNKLFDLLWIQISSKNAFSIMHMKNEVDNLQLAGPM